MSIGEERAGELTLEGRGDEDRNKASGRAQVGEGVRWEEERKGHTLNVTSRLSPSSKTVDLTCFPSSIKVIPTYKETFNINLKTPSALITELSASSQ